MMNKVEQGEQEGIRGNKREQGEQGGTRGNKENKGEQEGRRGNRGNKRALILRSFCVKAVYFRRFL